MAEQPRSNVGEGAGALASREIHACFPGSERPGQPGTKHTVPTHAIQTRIGFPGKSLSRPHTCTRPLVSETSDQRFLADTLLTRLSHAPPRGFLS